MSQAQAQAQTHTPTAQELEWAVGEVRRQAIPGAPGWFRAWPQGDEKWATVNIRAATQIIVKHSSENPDSWLVRAVFGTKWVELHLGPYDDRMHAVLVAHAVLHVSA